MWHHTAVGFDALLVCNRFCVLQLSPHWLPVYSALSRPLAVLVGLSTCAKSTRRIRAISTREWTRCASWPFIPTHSYWRTPPCRRIRFSARGDLHYCRREAVISRGRSTLDPILYFCTVSGRALHRISRLTGSCCARGGYTSPPLAKFYLLCERGLSGECAQRTTVSRCRLDESSTCAVLCRLCSSARCA